MLDIKIEDERFPNPVYCTIHINKALPNAGSCASDTKPTEDIKALFDSLSSIEGVVEIKFNRKYEIGITKGKVFSWEKIIKEASKVICAFYVDEQ